MVEWKKIAVSPDTQIITVIEVIDRGGMQVAIVVDCDSKLLGLVTDGDVRRGLLSGVSLTSPVSEIMNKNPATVRSSDDRGAVVTLMKARGMRQVPIVDANGGVVGIEILDDFLWERRRGNLVVIMAGGLGSRLGHLTKDCPKPLLPMGKKPLLERIIERCVEQGFRRFAISVNYKAEMIKDFLGDGSRWEIDISYIHEHKRMGTAGSLSLLPILPESPIFVINADILTKIDLVNLLNFHEEQKAVATMCVREYEFQVQYGTVKLDGYDLVGIVEKPIHKVFINAGMYVVNPEVLEYIPSGEFFDMPNLFQKIIDNGHKTTAFPVREYWLDIGLASDYERALGDFPEVFE
jgi:dTDP-glucose pyrophosphorylase